MENKTQKIRQPVLFLPHGGGPCFFMDWPGWENMEVYLRNIASTLPQRPTAIVVMSGHWETSVPTVITAENHTLLYDYYGFPKHTYALRYPAQGSRSLAARVRGLLAEAGIQSAEDDRRGLDHGVFIPFLLAFPNGDIPIVELSMGKDLDAAHELRVGQALELLRDENVLIVATGMTYHNLNIFGKDGGKTDPVSKAFDDWLAGAVEASPQDRNRALVGWERAPGARICHPRDEHLPPLSFASGGPGSAQRARNHLATVLGKPLSGFRMA